jgi:hypothetical protein
VAAAAFGAAGKFEEPPPQPEIMTETIKEAELTAANLVREKITLNLWKNIQTNRIWGGSYVLI